MSTNGTTGIVTCLEFDHPETYCDFDDVKKSFLSWIEQISKLFIVQGRASSILDSGYFNQKTWISYETNGRVCARNIQFKKSHVDFDVDQEGVTIVSGLKIPLPGKHNLENSLAAAAACLEVGLTWDQVKDGLATFPGVQRRSKTMFSNTKCHYIDDYAHHPSEITCLINSQRHLYRNCKALAIFEPHMFTRTKAFAKEFGVSLGLADEVWILDIHPAREAPLAGVTSEIIMEYITAPSSKMISAGNLLNELKSFLLVNKKQHLLIFTIGAGPIGNMVAPIKDVIDMHFKDTI